MKKSIKFLGVIVVLTLLYSFTNRKTNYFVGTYGVSDENTSGITLTIKEDNTFIYKDLTRPDKQINVNGTWHIKGKKIVLEGLNTDEKFHNVWSIIKNGNVAKSHRGFLFYRLCKIS